MGKIMAIGGGELADYGTYAIDREIVNLSGKDEPVALFIPTASGDPDGYIESFDKIYRELGCKTDNLKLIHTDLTETEIKDKILNADIIYVGGGDTERMLEIWKTKKVDVFLKMAFEKNIVLSGLSAGSICWFKYGQSDSHTYRTGKKHEFFLIEGLGLIDGLHCPHYTEENREEDFDAMILSTDYVGIALDDHCAIEIVDQMFRIVKSQQDAKAYKIYKKNGSIMKTELENPEFEPIEKLTERG